MYGYERERERQETSLMTLAPNIEVFLFEDASKSNQSGKGAQSYEHGNRCLTAKVGTFVNAHKGRDKRPFLTDLSQAICMQVVRSILDKHRN